MITPVYFDGHSSERPTARAVLPETDRERQTDPSRYIADPGLVDAVNVALMLGQPLLVTGEPGTGKTQLASRIAWELGLDQPLKFETKSNSASKDLFYTYDALRRFHASRDDHAPQDARHYITYNALGLAIIYASVEAQAANVLPSGFSHPGRRRSVVLIDEIDKAPRDFPNDLLNEVEHMYFRIPELNNVSVHASSGMRPVLVITSNSEKNLPDPFLRRCVYYNIPFPDKDRLAKIILNRVTGFSDPSSPLLSSAIAFFDGLRARNLRKPPATSELINWLEVLKDMGAAPNRPLGDSSAQLKRSLSALLKALEDVDEANKFVVEYLARSADVSSG